MRAPSLLQRFGSKGWDALTARQRRSLRVAGGMNIALLGYALFDWYRRPAHQMHGPKWLWLPLLFVNVIGPMGYLQFGRAKHASAPL